MLYVLSIRSDLLQQHIAARRVSGEVMKLAFYGGLYSNYLALEAAISDALTHDVDAMYCLGDLGAFGPYPDRVFPLLRDNSIACVQGNYDDSIGNELDDCQCGYTDPRDNHFAQISYDYTLKNTSDNNNAWLRELPKEIRLNVDGLRILLWRFWIVSAWNTMPM
jgi:predicted phosphodiesterase